MSAPDRKFLCGGAFAQPEVKAIMLDELRAMDTSQVVAKMPSVSELRHLLTPKPMTGLVEWYRIWMR
ncbi:MAG TPA: hypothetical protein VKT78_20660, partial [Fimbriimonadaceae bacterium]|nr:hypothetical protein [Fimbriimonadaceae bacterium]